MRRGGVSAANEMKRVKLSLARRNSPSGILCF